MTNRDPHFEDAMERLVEAARTVDFDQRVQGIVDAKASLRAFYATGPCNHSERHCPVCDGSTDACRETLRSEAEV
jgi:hypothetical protein